MAQSGRRSTGRLCWDEKRALFADTPEKKVFSQHANVLAVLTDAIPQTDQIPLLKRLLADSTLIQCTMYYRFYLYRALIKAGLGERYVDLLDPWHDMLRIGLTTCSERPEPTRSDCHAWSASPNFDFLATVCGIMPDEPGFRSVRIAPHPGSLKWVKGEMPHPAGMIRVGFERTGLSGLSGEVQLPDGLTGRMIWNGREIFLRGGVQNVAFE
jgi:alpha-L-rhamnosidase